MSTILKALRRLEREKSSSDGRPLQDEVAAAAALPSRRHFPIAGIGAALAALGLGLGGSLFWLWPRENAAPELAAASSARPRALVVRDVPSEAPAPPDLAASPAAPVVAAAPPPEAFSSPVAVVEHPAPPPVAEPAPAPAEAGAAEADEPAASAPAAATSGLGAAVADVPSERAPIPGELPPFATRSRAARRAPPPAAVARPVEVARAEPPAPAAERSLDRAPSEPLATTAPPAAPALRPKPAPEKVVRADLPDVFVSSTVWHPQKDRRLARVELAGGATRELHEGDAIGPLVVSEIEPSGVVFVHDGIELRRRVGAKN